MNDAEIVSWYYAKHVENSKRQQRKDRIKEKEVKPSTSEKISTSRERQKHTKSGSEEKRSSSGQKSSRKLADFADLDIEEPDRNLKRSKDETVREWLSYNNFGIADDTLHEEREVDDLPGTQMASISTKINEQKTLKSYNQQSLPSPFPDKIVHKRRKPKKKVIKDNRNVFKNSSGHQMYIKEVPFPDGVSTNYEKAKIENFLTEEEANIEEETIADIYPRYNHLQEQRRTDNICDLIHHTVYCYKVKSRSQQFK
ncbi:unnamed protein product [Oikopleura dioica]|uniref:Uncharacterized protein n=1 Tax=Oikopleura dioica TaxID=34765 RepID=E4WXI2_OIKDI|nr:unnamed protein product [Oikopleura dioica]